MTTLKEHQAAMVDLLANGSGIPASASRLAHAMHDVLGLLIGNSASFAEEMSMRITARIEATTPGLNEKALSKPVAPFKTDSPAKWPASAESRIKELENTIRQLRGSNAKLKQDLAAQKAISETHAAWIRKLEEPEQAGVRKEDTQVCEHSEASFTGDGSCCTNCGAPVPPEQYI